MSREPLVVTSFSREGAELYGRRCVESIRAQWRLPVVAYVDEPMMLPVQARLTSDIPGIECRRSLPTAGRRDGYKPTNYIWNAAKFSVKPFVWLDAAKRLGDGLLIWVDGDTLATKPLPSALVDDVMDSAALAYIGRGSMHPEMGCVVFRLPDVLPLLERCVGLYVSGGFRHLQDGWTDCHVFRAALQSADMLDIRHRSRDLTSHLLPNGWRSSHDAMALSPLGPYLTHLKGARKREAA